MEKRRRSKNCSRTGTGKRLLLHEKRLKSKGFSLIAGVDEAGRGPLAGPVVAAAVILKTFDFAAVIDDSKRLSEAARETAFAEIRRKAFVGVGVVDEAVIDAVNIHRATLRAMEAALRALAVAPDYVLLDGRATLDILFPQRAIIGGDAKSVSIAAASIIAKVTRDRIMRRYDRRYPAYGFGMHKGYPTPYHKAMLAKHGPAPIHRSSYAPVARCLEERALREVS